MPLDYGKFDHLEDSDDDKPDPRLAEMEARRREMAEQMRARLAGEEEAEDQQKSGQDSEDKATHQTDRFAYGESDCKKLAEDLLRTCVVKTPSVKVSNGVLSVTGVEKLEGDATMFKVRGTPKHTWDFSFKLKWTYQWMGTNFDQGAQRAEGGIGILEFTDATSFKSEKCPLTVKKYWTDKGELAVPRQKEIEAALGGKPWPPAEGTLLFGLIKTLEFFTEELPKQTMNALMESKQSREECAKEEEEEFKEGGGVRIEEVES